MKQAYGVPIPKEGIDMSKTPLYGKQVIDIRDNVIKKNKVVSDTVKNLKGNFNHFEGAPYKKLPPMGEEIFQPNAFNNVNPKYFQKGGTITGSEKNFLNDFFKDGGEVVKDNNGYWNPNNWGKNVEISSPNITMKGVNQTLLGVANTGERKIMQPDNDYYFKGAKTVTEIPLTPQEEAFLRDIQEKLYAKDGGLSNYTIREGDTLSKISKNMKIPLNTLANANNLSNPDLIITGKSLNIPTKFDRELTFKEIPTNDNKKIVIDNYSKHYDYIVEGDKTYYKTKEGQTWADISDNKEARSNLIKFIDKNNYWAGYSSGENNKTAPTVKKAIKQPTDTRTIGQLTNTGTTLPNAGNWWKTPEKNTNQIQNNPFGVIQPPKFDYFPKSSPPPKTEQKIQPKKQEHDLFDIISKSYNEGIDKISDIASTAKNGISRYIDKNITEEGDDKEIKEQTIPLNAKEYYSSQSTQQVLDANNGRTYKQQSLPINSATWGYRNRGEYKDLNTIGLEITAFDPFDVKNNRKGTSVMALDTISGNVEFGKFDDIKSTKNKVFSKTYMNKVADFSYDKEGNLELKSGSVSGNSSFKQPVISVFGDDGKIKKGSLNVLLKDKDSKDKYGSIQGGRVIVKNPDSGEINLISGSVNHITSEFKRLKGNSKYLEMYTLDNGTYARGLSKKDNKLTSKDLRGYDNENTSGGNGLYIKNFKTQPNKYTQEIVPNMPNVRSKEDKSFEEGHPLKNQQLNIILHHTAYTNDKTNSNEVRQQYMKKGNNSSHVVIEEDGSRTIYASPEQVAFHAGESKWKGRDNVNDFGIGVEFQGDTNKKPLTDAQIDSFIEYYKTINNKKHIPIASIITHQMIAPGRKPDITDKEYKRVLEKLKKAGFK
jgi:LysM repeat protein